MQVDWNFLKMNFMTPNIYTGKDVFGICFLSFQKIIYRLVSWKHIPEHFVQREGVKFGPQNRHSSVISVQRLLSFGVMASGPTLGTPDWSHCQQRKMYVTLLKTDEDLNWPFGEKLPVLEIIIFSGSWSIFLAFNFCLGNL